MGDQPRLVLSPLKDGPDPGSQAPQREIPELGTDTWVPHFLRVPSKTHCLPPP